MSTNYYFNPSKYSPFHCYGQLHIGKSSAGWSFSFQGYDFKGGKVKAVVDSRSNLVVMITVPSCVIRSSEDWVEVLLHGSISDEYGTEVTSEQFQEVTKRTNYCGNLGYLRNHAKEYPDNSWLDANGNSFTGCDFS